MLRVDFSRSGTLRLEPLPPQLTLDLDSQGNLNIRRSPLSQGAAVIKKIPARFQPTVSRSLAEASPPRVGQGTGPKSTPDSSVAGGRGVGIFTSPIAIPVKLLKGTLSIESQPKRGTTIHARVPLRSGSDSIRARIRKEYPYRTV